MVMKPKEKGGLSVLNLNVQNDALLLKHLHKFYNKMDIPWVKLVWSKYYEDKIPHATREVGSFWWKDVLRLSTLFRGIARCTVGEGKTVTFWGDLWSDDVLARRFPRLFSFAKDENASVNAVMSAEDLDSLFYLPLSQEAFEEMEMLSAVLSTQSFDAQSADVWTYQWGSSKYSSKKLYKLAFNNMPAHPIFKWLWKSKCTSRIKFFAWMVLVDRLNTKVMLKRRNLSDEDDDAQCVLCTEAIDEDWDHLFFGCSFARRCWRKIGIQWNNNLSLYARVAQARQQQNLPFFMEAVVIATWEIWKIRNDRVFNNGPVHVGIWFRNFKNECLLQSLRFKDDLRSTFCFWLDAFS